MALPPIQPIIPVPKKEPFDDPEWLFEFKYDGFRALLYLEPGAHCHLVSRNGNILKRFDALCRQVAAESSRWTPSSWTAR
jgi:ATP-dependent DNA ligase